MLLAHTTAASNYNMGANRPYWHTRPVCFEKHVVKVCGFICGLDIFWEKTCFRGPLMVARLKPDPVTQMTSDGTTPLALRAYEAHLEATKTLLLLGAPVTIRDMYAASFLETPKK